MDPTSAPVVPGYAMGALLGRGAVASVWAARRMADGQPLAIKVVPSSRESCDEGVRELSVLRGVGGEHLVALLDAVPVRDPDGLALVMERYDGGSLAAVVGARGRLTGGETVTVVSPVAAALGALHARGIVHGDVAPGNVLFDAAGRPALADLGVARILGEERSEVWGTDGFVAPEVVAGGPPTPAADVYAAGALAWYALTGQPPGPSYLRPRAITLDGVPGALAEVLDRCLAADPHGRPGAVEASDAFYGAVAAEPLRLPGDADAVASLTRRIRARAVVPAEPDPDSVRRVGRHARGRARARRRRWRRWRPGRPTPSRAGVSRDATRSPARAVSPPRAGSSAGAGSPAGVGSPPRAGSPKDRRVAMTVATAVVVAVLATVTALVAITAGWDPRASASAGSSSPSATGSWDRRAEAGTGGASHATPRPTATSRSVATASSTAATRREAAGPATPPEAPAGRTATATSGSTSRAASPSSGATASPSTTRPPDTSVLRDRDAVRTNPVVLARALAWTRARLWTAVDPDRVTDLDAAGSAAATTDAATLRTARSGGWSYTGVAFTVRSVTVESSSATQATLRVVLDSAAYRVDGPSGSEQRPARTGQASRLHLAWTADGWRVAQVTAG